MRQLILDIRPDAPAGFDNFLPGPNAEAVAALAERTLPATPYAGDHVIYLWGEPGVGRTHLLQAWAAAAGAPCLPSGPVPETPSLMAMDDVDTLGEADQIRLFSALNAARENGGRIIASGPLPPAQLAIRPDLATRLAQGLVYRLLPLTDADKAAALATRAEARGMQLADEVIRYMLSHCRRDLPWLLATVDHLDEFSLSRKRPASLPLLKELLQATTTA